jgi:hypothetical protein
LQKPKKSKIQFFLKLITRTKPSKRECTWNIVLPIETTFAVDFIVTEIADLIYPEKSLDKNMAGGSRSELWIVRV